MDMAFHFSSSHDRLLCLLHTIFELIFLYILNGCLVVIKTNKMATREGNYRPIEAEDLLARLSDLDKHTNDSDDSFDILEAGMDTGELDEVSFICESSNNGDNGDEDNWSVAGSIGHYNPSLPGPSTAPVSLSEDSESSDGDSGDSSDFTDSTSGEEETRTKHPRKPTKKWKKGS